MDDFARDVLANKAAREGNVEEYEAVMAAPRPRLRKQIVALEVIYDPDADDIPATWGWGELADLGPDESIRVLAEGPVEEVS